MQSVNMISKRSSFLILILKVFAIIFLATASQSNESYRSKALHTHAAPVRASI